MSGGYVKNWPRAIVGAVVIVLVLWLILDLVVIALRALAHA